MEVDVGAAGDGLEAPVVREVLERPAYQLDMDLWFLTGRRAYDFRGIALGEVAEADDQLGDEMIGVMLCDPSTPAPRNEFGVAFYIEHQGIELGRAVVRQACFRMGGHGGCIYAIACGELIKNYHLSY